VNDIADRAGIHIPEILIKHSLVSLADSNNLDSHKNTGTHHSPDACIHSGGIAAGSKNTYFFYF
jgi:hypothetical protein